MLVENKPRVIFSYQQQKLIDFLINMQYGMLLEKRKMMINP